MNESSWISYNNQVFDSNSKILSASNRSYLYGDGLFETIRVYHGVALHAELHWARLNEGMKLLGYAPLESTGAAFIQHQVQLFTEHTEVENGRMRLQVFRSGKAPYLPKTNEATVLCHFELMEGTPFQTNEKGIRLGIFRDVPLVRSVISTLKTSSALAYVLGSKFVGESALDEAVLLNTDGFVADCCWHNLLLLRNGELVRASSKSGGVRGVMQERLKRICEEMRIHYYSSFISIKDIEEAEAVFLTNAIRGVQWVSNFRDHNYGPAICRELNTSLAQSALSFPPS